MRILLLLPVIFVFCACSTESTENKGEPEAVSNIESSDNVQNELSKVSNEEITTIPSIQEQYANTMKSIESGRTDSTSFMFDCNGERSGTVTYHRLKGDIVMVEKEYGEYSHTEATEQYFVSNGEPYFIFYKTLHWSFDFEASVEGAVRDNFTEERYYILNDSLARCLEKKYVIRSASNESPDPVEVENRSVDCPSIQKLKEEFDLLLTYKDETEKLSCL